MKSALIRAIGSILLVCLVNTAACGQDLKFKFPAFTPFKKQSGEIKPIQLSDSYSDSRGIWPGGTEIPGQQPGPLASFGQKSMDFFKKTGDDLSKFSSSVRDKFRVPESPGWGSDNHGHWWNDAPDATELYRDLQGMGFRTPKTMPAVPPAPLPDRTAHGWPVSPPKFRF